jgi:hypothetical protein
MLNNKSPHSNPGCKSLSFGWKICRRRENNQLTGNQTFFMPFPENFWNPILPRGIIAMIYRKNRMAEKNFAAIFGRYLKVASSGGLGPACFQAGRQPMD